MSHPLSTHLCPYCHKTSYGPPRLDTFDGFPIICAHCGGQFSQETDAVKADAQQATDCPIICSSCLITMRISQSEYEALSDHALACPACDKGLRLPQMPPLAPLPSAIGLTFRLGFIYLLILASLGLLFTPQGAQVITELAQISDRPAIHLAEFHKQWYGIWHQFLDHLQGLFL